MRLEINSFLGESSPSGISCYEFTVNKNLELNIEPSPIGSKGEHQSKTFRNEYRCTAASAVQGDWVTEAHESTYTLVEICSET